MIAMETIEKLSREKLPKITVLAGEDLGQYSQAKEKFLKQIGFDSSDLTYSYFDMSETDYQDAELDLESMPFFADEKVVIFDHFADMTTAKKSYLDEKALKRLENYLQSPVETTRLVLEANSLKDTELRTYFQKQAHQEGLTFDKGVFEELLVKSSFDFSDIQKNLAFLKGYKTEGNISSQDIMEAIPKSLQDNIFDMTQLLLRGQIQDVRELVHDLRLQGEDEIKLIAVMLGQFRTYLQVKLLSAQGKSEQQIVSSLSDYLSRKVNPFQVRYAIRDSRHLSVAFLKTTIKTLVETDYQIKTGTLDKDYLLDLALLKIASNS
ncbi:DNA polymerase III subunit delta [Streptococcus thermophilus]|uniref:DNA polymerase III subunit delta n=1 Tax=Streptococcus thermophilus TaxID=1308 RepID=UPI001A985B43|nr:DNA polymerase III subunit delta [Streptococcus thermophilus]MBO1161873.1 DNA polymerase III subunit delta [Streptococcus thermophilus]